MGRGVREGKGVIDVCGGVSSDREKMVGMGGGGRRGREGGVGVGER